MKIELLVIIVTGFLVFNIYHDGKYLKMLKQWKKYYQMAFYAFLGLSLLIFLKKYPSHSKDLFSHAHSFVKFMPIDKNSSDLLSPLFKISSQKFNQFGGANEQSVRRIKNSGIASTNTKRSVSETKKKYVASQQNWKCAGCSSQLNAWFEVDHKTRLEHGGDNHINNLEALCRECHGKKTAMENF
tara:strand:- start:3293 stop:3847 length:555 start_codon:yes stop_codon:yes gene_type:complete